MRNRFAAFAAATLTALGMAATASASDLPAGPTTYPLHAGGGTASAAVQVGTVTVEDVGTQLKVTYQITGDLTPANTADDGVPTLMYSVAVDAACRVRDIPQSSGNPVPGQFEGKASFPEGTDTATLYIDDPDCGPPNTIYVAAHADVKKLGGMDGLNSVLPQQVTYSVAYPGTGSYFDTTFLSGYQSGSTFSGWCVDIGHYITPGTTYTGTAYSGYELPTGATNIDHPENMDLVAWLINNYAAGQTVTADFNGDGVVDTATITAGTMQRAIWSLVDNTPLDAWAPDVNEDLAAWLAAQARQHDGFTPGCGQLVPIVIVGGTDVQTTIVQTTFAQLRIPCTTVADTAWATTGQTVTVRKGKTVLGIPFSGSNWAAYVIYQGA